MSQTRSRGVARLAALLAAAAAVIVPGALQAQGFGGKPMRLIVRAPPGGTDDLIARLIGPAITKASGQQVVVDYRPGAGGLVAWDFVAKQPPDGQTVLLAASGLAAVRSLRSDTTLDPFRDFAWVTQVTSFMLALMAHPSLPTRNAKDLIALAKRRPGQMSFGSSGFGATPHLAFEYFNAMAGVKITHVPYKGGGPMYLDLIAGRIELGAGVVGAALPHIRSGKVRALAVSGAQRSPQLPEVPTVAESAIAGFEFEPFYALCVPAATSREIQQALADLLAKATAGAEFREQFNRIVGSEVVVNSPDRMLQVARREADLIAKIVKASGIQPE